MFWGLSASLAYKRHFPAIDWLVSYSLYADKLGAWFKENVGADYNELRAFVMRVLQEEAELEEIVRLVGMDALSYKERMTMECAKIIREDYLHQNAFHEIDTYTSLNKQYKILKLIYEFYRLGNIAIDNYAELDEILSSKAKERIGRAKYVEERATIQTHEGELYMIDILRGGIKNGDERIPLGQYCGRRRCNRKGGAHAR